MITLNVKSSGDMKNKLIVYRIQEEGQRLDPLSVMLIPKWVQYTYLHPEVYLTKEAAENNLPKNIHAEDIHARYYVFEQEVIDE